MMKWINSIAIATVLLLFCVVLLSSVYSIHTKKLLAFTKWTHPLMQHSQQGTLSASQIPLCVLSTSTCPRGHWLFWLLTPYISFLLFFEFYINEYVYYTLFYVCILNLICLWDPSLVLCIIIFFFILIYA